MSVLPYTSALPCFFGQAHPLLCIRAVLHPDEKILKYGFCHSSSTPDVKKIHQTGPRPFTPPRNRLPPLHREYSPYTSYPPWLLDMIVSFDIISV